MSDGAFARFALLLPSLSVDDLREAMEEIIAEVWRREMTLHVVWDRAGACIGIFLPDDQEPREN